MIPQALGSCHFLLLVLLFQFCLAGGVCLVRCIRGLLKEKPVVLVTHQLQYLREATRILVLDQVSAVLGCIVLCRSSVPGRRSCTFAIGCFFAVSCKLVSSSSTELFDTVLDQYLASLLPVALHPLHLFFVHVLQGHMTFVSAHTVLAASYGFAHAGDLVIN